jgi:PPOX class probable F420-dependent enzyme
VIAGRFVSAVDQKRKRVPGRVLARVRWLRARPAVALTIDHYEDDWSQLAWVQVLGRAQLLEVGDAAEELAALTDRYPQYRVAPPPGPIVIVVPERILCWREG